MMWWFARQEEPPPGLPDGSYGLVKLKDGWWYMRSWDGQAQGERYRDGPYPEKEDARWWAWKDAKERGVCKEP